MDIRSLGNGKELGKEEDREEEEREAGGRGRERKGEQDGGGRDWGLTQLSTPRSVKDCIGNEM